MTDLTVSFLFDLDGTLVDSVYQHVLAWHEALQDEGIELSIWRIHRKIGMSGGLFTNMLFRETGLEIDAARIERLRKRHAAAYKALAHQVRPLPGARRAARLPDRRRHPVGDRHQRPDGDRRADHREARRRSRQDPGHHPRQGALRQARPGPVPRRRRGARHADRPACVVGDSVWDMLAARRAGGLGVGLLSGGYGEDELVRASAYRVYEDPADLLRHIDEVGGRR